MDGRRKCRGQLEEWDGGWQWEGEKNWGEGEAGGGRDGCLQEHQPIRGEEKYVEWSVSFITHTNRNTRTHTKPQFNAVIFWLCLMLCELCWYGISLFFIRWIGVGLQSTGGHSRASFFIKCMIKHACCVSLPHYQGPGDRNQGALDVTFPLLLC